MAQISYETSNQFKNNSNSSNLPGFFSLKNDNDEAVVRFMCDSTKDFEIVTTHQIQTANGRFRNVNCIRDPREPIDNCPFCRANMPVRQRFYIHLIAYVKGENGQIIPTPMVWERSSQYAEKLKSYIDNYGPLSDIICKVIRHGAAGSMQTTYEIVPNLSKVQYPDNVYPKITDAFEDYHAVGTTVLDKSFPELAHYVQFGEFPQMEETTQASQPIPATTPTNMTTPFESSSVASNIPQRPVRYFDA